MSKLVELQEKRAQAWEAAKNFLEGKRSGGGTVTPEDRAAYEAMEQTVLDLTTEIECLERQEALSNKISARQGEPILNPPGAGIDGGGTGRASKAYNNAFWNAMRSKTVSNDLNIGSDSAGGYLVPDQFERTLVQALEEHNIMRQLARVITTSSGELQIPVVASTGTAAWIAEGAEIPLSDGTFGQVTLGAFKLGTMIKVTHELLKDSAFPIDSFLAQDFARRMGQLEEDAFIKGNGINKPTGFLVNAPVGVTAPSATALTFDDVMDLYRSLKSPYRNKAVFIANDLTIGALQKLKDNNGQVRQDRALCGVA